VTTISQTGVTDLLVHWSEGDQEALNKLIPLVYDELHKLASRYLRRERRDHTLQTTAVVHEAYLKSCGGTSHIRGTYSRGDCASPEHITQHGTTRMEHGQGLASSTDQE